MMGTKGRRFEWLENLNEARLREIIFDALDESEIPYMKVGLCLE